jgi:hypothetical protein
MMPLFCGLSTGTSWERLVIISPFYWLQTSLGGLYYLESYKQKNGATLLPKSNETVWRSTQTIIYHIFRRKDTDTIFQNPKQKLQVAIHVSRTEQKLNTVYIQSQWPRLGWSMDTLSKLNENWMIQKEKGLYSVPSGHAMDWEIIDEPK